MAQIGILDLDDTEFDVEGFSWAPQRATVSGGGTSGSSGGMVASIHDVSLTITNDSDTPALFRYAAQGTPFDTATLKIYQDASNSTSYEFTSAIVASAKADTTSGEAATVIVGLNFDSVTMAYD